MRIESELRREEAEILGFTLDQIHPLKGAKTPISEVFIAYKLWRVSRGLPRTKISVDSFGKLFPETIPRKMFWINQTAVRALDGYSLR